MTVPSRFLTRSAAILVLLGAGLATAAAQTPPPVIPAPQVEVVPAVPPGAWVWQPGHWRWNGYQYVWLGGRYVHPHPRRDHWIEAHWAWRHGAWVWINGHWG
jgi:hypothetical protein